MHRVYVQSARLSVQSSELGPLTRKRVLPPFGSKRGEPLACGEGGGDPILKKVDTLHYTKYIPLQSTVPGFRPKYHFSRAWVILPFKEVIFSSTLLPKILLIIVFEPEPEFVKL